ncbi:hypothetical protein Tco_1549326, partial [Tanacetum coccineum]
MKHRAVLGHVLHDVYAIIDHFGDSAKRKSSRVVIAILVVAASAYFIWQERNWRLFKGTKRSVQQVIDLYWASILAIPHGISSDIHHLIRSFLWCNGDLKRGKAKVTWNDISPNLSSIAVSSLVNSSRDCFCWRDSNGNLVVFSVRLAWEELRDRRTDVTWSLKTQDKLRPWDVAPNTDMSSFRFLDDIFLWFQSLAHSRSFKAVVGKLIVAASSYFIWNERNNRFKNTARVKELFALWKMPISDYARVLVEVSADKPLVESVDIDIPRKDGKGYITANVRIEFDWQPPRCGTCKFFDHLESVCPMNRAAGPSKKCDTHADVKKDKRPVHVTGKKGKGKQVSTQYYIKGYRVNIPKSKLVYRAVVKPQGAYNVASNMEQSLDTTKKPSPVDSSKN